MTILPLSISRRLVTVLLPGIFLALVALPRPVLADCVKIRAGLRQEKGLIKRHNILKEAIKECPDDPKITYFYAYNLERLRKYDQARELYRRAVELDPDFARAWFGLGEMYLAAGDPENAIQALEKGLSIEPAIIWAQRSLKEARSRYADQQEARQKAMEAEKTARPAIAVDKRAVEKDMQSPTGAGGGEKTASRAQAGSLQEQVATAKKGPAQEREADHTAPAPGNVGEQTPVPPSPPAPANLQLSAAASGEIVQGKATETVAVEQTKASPTTVSQIKPARPEKKEDEKKNRIVVRALTEEEIVSFMELHPARGNSNPAGETTGLRMPIQFERNSGELTEEARNIIDQVICPALKNDKLAGAVYELAGHTDDRGDFDTNMYLSRIRVYTVRDYLVASCGIDPSRLRVVYYGPTRPLVPNTSAANRRLNRRVEIRRLQ
ncbi:OmpA family protein [Desulfolithobacter sp.]